METDLRIQPIVNKQTIESGNLQLSPIDINEEYCKKWNIHMADYVCLTRNGELVNNVLYRIGGINYPDLRFLKSNYIMLLKHVEALYDDSIAKDIKSKRHLEGRWCIIDKNGNEKVVLDSFRYGYVVKNSQIYSVERNYYNIESGEFYCCASNSMDTEEYLFLENAYDKNESKRGVMKINKKDSSWELFKQKQ